MSLTEAALLREVARVQHDKTMLAVRDLVDRIALKKDGSRSSYSTVDRSAGEFKKDLLAGLRAIDEATR